MIIEFYKYEGTGNDFIIIDNRELKFKPYQKSISKLCNRRFGIGADGLILLQNKKGYDFEMIYFNSNGNEGSMCGNGGRCITALANHLGITKNETKFSAIDGEHQSIVISENNNISTISLKMLDVNKIEVYDDFYFINTGSPHYVKFINNINNFDVYNKGKKIRYDKKFIPTGTNVDFVEIIKNAIFVRTYERGVENETLSCGTGVIASALATAIKTGSNNDFFNIQTKGGNLKVSFKKYNNSFTDIWLEGPVSFVFKGEINYSNIL